MKKYSHYILIAVIIMTIVVGPFPFGAKPAHADGCFDIDGLHWNVCLAKAGYSFLQIGSWALGVSGVFFDSAIEYSVINMRSNSQAFVKSGWEITRDLANMFFIFILLYIAIATILQISGYGLKNLLVTVVIIALLVNFSLVFSRVIIDASNVLALEFYNKVNVLDKVKGKKLGLSSAIMSGLRLQTTFDVDTNTSAGKQTSAAEKFFKQGDPDTTALNIFIIGIGGTALFLVTAYVLAYAGILFLIRTAILWIVMIFAPLAFLAMILPKTQEYSKKWWGYLFSQSFFAPVYMFLFYIVVSIVSKGSILQGLAKDKAFSAAIVSPGPENVELVISFAIVIILMMACVKVAKSMGAVGTGMADKMMKWTGKKVKGTAGRVGKRYAGRFATEALEQMDTGQGRVTKALRIVPFLHRGLAGVAQLKKKEVGTYEKQYSKYDTKTLEHLRNNIGTTREAKEAMNKIIEKGNEKKKEEKRLKELREIIEDPASAKTQVLKAALEEDKILRGQKEKELEEKEEALKEKGADGGKGEEKKQTEPEKKV